MQLSTLAASWTNQNTQQLETTLLLGNTGSEPVWAPSLDGVCEYQFSIGPSSLMVPTHFLSLLVLPFWEHKDLLGPVMTVFSVWVVELANTSF